VTALRRPTIHKIDSARIVAIVACCGGLLAACSAPDNKAPDSLIGGGGGPSGSGSTSSGQGGAPDAEPAPSDGGTDGSSADPPKRYGGALAATETFDFGGSGFCKYQMTLKDVLVDVRVLPTGEVSAATVKDLAVEKAIDCPHAPMPESKQSFTLKSSTIVPSGVRVELNGASTNRPKTALVVDLTAKAGGYEAALTWHRTDQAPPLDWTVTATIQLAPK
jgi:hypothetical protein